MTTAQRSRTKTTKGGFGVKTFAGLNKKRMEPRGGNASFGVRVRLDANEPVPVQFYTEPDNEAGFLEFDTHAFREDGRWTYVPCMGDDCPLCEDEDPDRKKTTYRFLAKVYNLKTKKPQLLEGPGDLARRIHYRWSRRPGSFLKRTFEITKLETTPVTYDVAVGDDPVVRLTNIKAEEFEAYLSGALKSYYGEHPPSKSALAAADDLDEEADGEEDEAAVEDDIDVDELREELENLTPAKLKARAKKNGAALKEYKDLDEEELIEFIVVQEAGEDAVEDDEADDEADDVEDDEDDDDLDLDEDDDDTDEDDDEDLDEDDDEEEPPAPARKSPGRKAPARKAPARKSPPAKKSAARRR